MWSAFRFEYSRIHTIRSLLPVDTVVFAIACAATLNLALRMVDLEGATLGIRMLVSYES
jgi:hypothetical protein